MVCKLLYIFEKGIRNILLQLVLISKANHPKWKAVFLNTPHPKSQVPIYWSLIARWEKAMAPHSCTLAWKIPWMEEPDRLQSMGSLRVGHDWATSLSRIGEGNGNSLQCSCLENPRDGGAWWAAVSGVAQSQTRLKWLSSSSNVARSTGINARTGIFAVRNFSPHPGSTECVAFIIYT